MPPPDDAAAAVVACLRERVADELRRADRAEAIAASHEARSATAPAQLRELRTRMAALHRKMVRRHRTSAALHELHAIRMEAWLNGGRGPAFQPVFMAAVAAAMGVGSATATMRGQRLLAVVSASSDDVARAAHDLEVVLGEGPAITAMTEGAPVSADSGSLRHRWPLYGSAVGELGVRTVVAVPLRQAATCLGAICAYSPDLVLPDGLVTVAGQVADAVTRTVLLAPGPFPDPGFPGGFPGAPLFGESDYQAVVHQAAGMVSVQCGCGIDDAEDLLRARAFADGQPVEKVALAVLRGDAHLGVP